MTLDEAIKMCNKISIEALYDIEDSMALHDNDSIEKFRITRENHQQLAEWLTQLKKAKSIIRVCNRVLGYLLEHEIESTSTRHEVETLLKNITEYLSGGSENDT